MKQIGLLVKAKWAHLTKDHLVREILFTKDGLNLQPKVWTPGTAKLDPKDRIPSVSTKQYLPYFTDAPGKAGEFVRDFVDYVKAQKLLTTYIGNRDVGNGFWQYIAPDGAIYPSYKLQATVKGRSASEAPNGQNIPKRGKFAKSYNRVFKARPGYKLVSADLSQIELRVAAVMANDRAMLQIYAYDGDIHAATAAATMGISDAEFARISKDERKLNRTKAKAVCLGVPLQPVAKAASGKIAQICYRLAGIKSQRVSQRQELHYIDASLSAF